MLIFWILLGVAIVWIAGSYNKLVRSRMRAFEAWSDIEVQLKRRYNLIPNLVETVKGYAGHEEKVFIEVTQARAAAIGAGSVKEQAKAENMLTGALKTLFAVAENYPKLRAVESFLGLQNELTDTEDKIQAARRFYNGNVRDLNTAIQMFPSNIIANMFGFKEMDFFELGEGEEAEAAKKSVDVDFKDKKEKGEQEGQGSKESE